MENRIIWDSSRQRYRGWIGGAVWWYWPFILLWEWPRNWVMNHVIDLRYYLEIRKSKQETMIHDHEEICPRCGEILAGKEELERHIEKEHGQ
jgi:ribosomal protein S27AE